MDNYTLFFGDRLYTFLYKRTPTVGDHILVIMTQKYNQASSKSVSQGYWKVKNLHPVPNKNSVLSLAKTDSLI